MIVRFMIFGASVAVSFGVYGILMGTNPVEVATDFGMATLAALVAICSAIESKK